jgi:hypothetical protein
MTLRYLEFFSRYVSEGFASFAYAKESDKKP